MDLPESLTSSLSGSSAGLRELAVLRVCELFELVMLRCKLLVLIPRNMA